MISRRNVFTVALTALLGVAVPALGATMTGPVARLDTDNDGTVDLDEAKKAASALDGTVSAAEFKTAAGRSLSKLLS